MQATTYATRFGLLAMLLGASLALAVAGCASTAGLAPRSELTAAGTLHAERTFEPEHIAADTWPAADWWTRFGDPQLDALEQEALASSPSLAAARARVDKAMALAGLARAARRPSVDAGVTSTRRRYSENDVLPTPPGGTWQTPSDATLDFRYELDFWHKNRAALAAALNRIDVARLDAFAARMMLSVSVARTYVQLARLHDRLDVARATLAQREQILDLTRQRVTAGLDTRVELKQAEGALPAARVDIAALTESLDLMRHALAALLGAGPDRGLTIARPALAAAGTLTLPSTLPADLLGRRPDVIASRARVEAAGHDVDVAKAEFYPDIDLRAFAGFASLGLSGLVDAGSRVAGAGPALRLPIFDRQRLRSRLAARDADYDAAVEQYDETLVEALRDTSDGLASVRSVAEQRAEQQSALAAAREAYDLALARYRDGLGNYLSVLAVETEVLAQRRLEADLRARGYDTQIELIRALGGGFGGGVRLSSTEVRSITTGKSS